MPPRVWALAFAPKNRFQLFVRNTVLKMMGLPKVADIAMGRSFHDRVELPSFPELNSDTLSEWSDPDSPNCLRHQQQAIVQAALDEFAAHGFHDASLNRVIEAAGISKGSMYYYFDGKEDLYAYVAQAGLAGLFEQVGPLPDLGVGDADAFWSVLGDYYLRLMRALVASPQLAAHAARLGRRVEEPRVAEGAG